LTRWRSTVFTGIFQSRKGRNQKPIDRRRR